MFVRPKVYTDEVIGFDENGKVVIRYHKRCKGVSKPLVKEMGIDDFADMLDGKTKSFNMELFHRNYKKFDQPAVCTHEQKKIMWSARVFQLELSRFAPIGSNYERRGDDGRVSHH